MRAISLWQPWATAVALGSKRVETRHWSTPYRCALAIHAAKRKVISELIHYGAHWNWQGAMTGAGWSWGRKADGEPSDYDRLPFGAIVAICDLVDCRPTESFTQGELDERRTHPERGHLYAWTERQMGNFELGRFGWSLANIRALAEPIPFRGAQSFFQVPDDLIAAALPVLEMA